jgi:hypothetical protein
MMKDKLVTCLTVYMACCTEREEREDSHPKGMLYNEEYQVIYVSQCLENYLLFVF